MARRRRRYDDRYDPYDPYDPFDRPPPRWAPRRRYYQPAPGGTCLRDACFLQTGCCIGESLDGNCLVLTLAAAPGLVAALISRGRAAPAAPGSGRAAERMIAAIGVYRREISPRRPPSCRFEPTCSTYAVEALRVHGAARGSFLTLRRLMRCRPGGARGADPVPAAPYL